jgi:acetoin utilization deacetylase AcuC-like enzyme
MDKIPVFYTPKMVAESGCESPSAHKPKAVVASWLEKFPIEIIEPAPATMGDYARAHDREWVESVLQCRAPNGFGNKSPAVADALPYTSGAMLAAARRALKTRRVAAAPCSGFHHAGWSRAEGFCTFNGLMVAALALRAEGAVTKIGILDLDMHYGNGTADIRRRLGAEDWILHFSAGLEWTMTRQAAEFLNEKLPDVLEWLTLENVDIVLYQAGADPHVDDPYGGWLTTEQLRIRDALVFDFLGAQTVPVAWNLAGGYQVEDDGSIPKVLEIHDNTMRECIRVYGEKPWGA